MVKRIDHGACRKIGERLRDQLAAEAKGRDT
jgi:hypothetical protein